MFLFSVSFFHSSVILTRRGKTCILALFQIIRRKKAFSLLPECNVSQVFCKCPFTSLRAFLVLFISQIAYMCRLWWEEKTITFIESIIVFSSSSLLLYSFPFLHPTLSKLSSCLRKIISCSVTSLLMEGLFPAPGKSLIWFVTQDCFHHVLFLFIR